MIFQATYQQVLDGSKTQTRRLVKPGEYGVQVTAPNFFSHVLSRKHHVKWRLGNTYAVQPSRGKPAMWIPPEGAPIDDPLAEYIRKTEGVRATWGPKVKKWLRSKGYREARIRITRVGRERLRDIKWRDVKAEGIDISGIVSRGWNRDVDAGKNFLQLWDSLYRKPYRWEDNPEVWVLEFELVKEA